MRRLLAARSVSTPAAAALVLGLFLASASLPEAQAASPCDPPVANPIVCENSKPGNPSSEWDITGNGDDTIQGFATDMSVNKGDTVRFKVKTAATAYRLDIYRLGFYGGDGARKVATINPTAVLPQSQPACIDDATTGLHDCGNWGESASWPVPTSAVSGVYVARLVRGDTGGASHIVFVVRDDARASAVLFQTSDTTWQAYNSYGDREDRSRSLYPNKNGVAVKVSYNRPFVTRGGVPDGRDFAFANEYPMIRWMEANGYDTTYTTGIDSDRRGELIKQHKLFLSVGHDEYWSAQQRAHVEAARDAGVNLAFFGGNSVYWKTRWETSVDGSGTPYRTMVTYKETRANAKVDPDPAWTGTWRDPRFSPPADGGRPENQLMGTAYKVNTGQFAIEVPYEDGRSRFWRNTSVATMAPGSTAVLAPNTLGYEWDEDLDNGFRPAGLIHLSSTTKDVSEYLYDYGNTVRPGRATHHLTLYRAPSGALVFGAGTVQWSWGLDENHDGPTSSPDVRMQQATMNLFADMGVQPATVRPGLTRATGSTDSTPPTASITSPAPGATLASGSTVTVSGTAMDVGGVVGGVEVSTDGGSSWHPATGRTSWTYSWAVTGSGSVKILARATDDTANIGASSSAVTVNVSCPCRIFPSTAAPTSADSGDNQAIEVGVKFQSDLPATVSGVRFYKSTANTGAHVGSLWTANGTRLASASFSGETASGWQEVSFATPVTIDAFTTYVASYYAPVGRYAGDANAFAASGVDSAPLHALKSGADGGNGVYRYGIGGGFPNQSFGAANYWVDVVVASTGAPDTAPPTVSTTLPSPGSTSAPPSTKVQAAFNEPIQGGTVSFTVRDSAGSAVAGAVGYDRATRTSTFTPSASLGLGATYTASVSGAKDLSGNVMASPVTWSFTTASTSKQPGTCPCTIWSDSVVPATPATADTNGIEVGVKFRADKDGTVDAIRFYKGVGNDGPHVGSLWSSSGTLLGRVTFAMESPDGWQQASLPTPVPIVAGTTYVASYYAPNGRYAVTSGGLSAATDSPPLHALASGSDGLNGVYQYGGNSFPTQSYGAGNYWVDVSFSVPPDTTPPTVSSTAPGAGARSVPVRASAKALFSEPVDPASVGLALRDAADASVPGTVTYDAPTRTATFTPTSALAAGASYTATVSGAKDLAGNPLPGPVSWSFTTSGVGACPCTIFDTTSVPTVASTSDTSAVEVGVKFRADVDGYVYGVRFYKGAGNTGTHRGNLWSAAGVNLATAVFTGESATGWQQVSFASPVAVTAGTTYVASYHAPVGRYSADGGYFATAAVNSPLTGLANGADGGNGVYRYGTGGFPTRTYGAANYWVDVSFSTTPPPDTTPPTVTGSSPGAGATNVAVSAAPSATFSEPVQPATIVFSVRDAGNATAPGAVTYDAAKRTATFTPNSALAAGASYTATVSGAKDLAGNPLPGPVSWSFTTSGVGACPCTIFDSSRVPTVASTSDTSAVEVGVKFRADVDGYVYGVRFYKGAGNTGTHRGNLWSAAGVNLATAVFTGGASYHAPVGRYSADGGYFTTAAVNSPLTGLANGADGGNGVFRYGTGGFPTQSYGAANYWVDVSFSTTPPPDTTPPTVSRTAPLGGATSVPVGTTASATFDEDVQPTTLSMTLRDAANAVVSGTTTYADATRTVTFRPAEALAAGTSYTATVSGAKDRAGNAMPAPVAWSFTTATAAAPPGTCPCTIWTDATQPGTPAANDPKAIEVGVKFRADVNGYIHGVRFYKGAGNTGAHVGSLWTAAGARLATASFTNESTTGWQQVSFASPVAVTAGTTYVASYFAPNGHYALDGGYFASTGTTRGPLTALANGVDGSNGVYLYGTGGFPTNSTGAANYWVDVTFSTTPPDTTAPRVTDRAPAAGANMVDRSTVVTATFSEPVQAPTVSFVLTAAGGADVAATTAYDPATRTATLRPSSALAALTEHTATVSRATDVAGNVMAAPVSWSFTSGVV